MASKLALACLCLIAVVAVVHARPRFLAIPLEDVDELIGAPFPFRQPRLVRRQTDDEPETAASGSRGSGYSGNDYVDYGAYTGGYGAFGWYTDHPVGNSYSSGSY